MKHIETNPDQAIDRVLAGLRKAEPQQGMQQRVLQAARERAAVRPRWSLHLPLEAARSWAVAGAAVALVAYAASWTIVRQHRTAHETAHSPANMAPVNAPEAPPHLVSTHVTLPRKTREPKVGATEKVPVHVETVSDEDALAMSEMLAPSKPAPPLPLTHEERLLTEVVHHGAPEELASMKADVRAREMEVAKAEFHDFFEPTTLNRPPVKTTTRSEQTQE